LRLRESAPSPCNPYNLLMRATIPLTVRTNRQSFVETWQAHQIFMQTIAPYLGSFYPIFAVLEQFR
jgi:hypothetical protein